MQYRELINILKEIPLDDRLIGITYDVGNTFDLVKNGCVYYITIEKGYNKQASDVIYKKIIKEVGGIYTQNQPKILQLSWEQSLEALYHHYPYGYDNSSNCILVNTANRILAIQYNGEEKTTQIKTDCTFVPNFIVVNNKKKIEGDFSIKDYDNILLPLIKKICAE